MTSTVSIRRYELSYHRKDQTTRDAIRFLIEDEGHSAEGIAPSGRTWVRFKGKDFDAVLLDLELAQAGRILLEIRKNQPDLAVIMYCAEKSEGIAAEALLSGAIDCLEVPFQHEQLARILSQVQALRQTSQRISPTDQDASRKQRQSLRTTPPLKLIGWDETSGNTLPAKT